MYNCVNTLFFNRHVRISTLGGFAKGCFLVSPLQRVSVVYPKCNFPLPHVFPQPPFPLEREPTASAPRRATLSTRIDKYRSLIMSLRFVRQLRNNTAQSLVLSVKLGIRYLAAVAARTSNRHIPCIRTLQISFHLSAIQTQFGYHRTRCDIIVHSTISSRSDIIPPCHCERKRGNLAERTAYHCLALVGTKPRSFECL